MIDSFGNKETEKIWHQVVSTTLPIRTQRTVLRRLQHIHGASSTQDLAASPANELENLVGEKKEQLSIRIDGQRRLCFYFRDGHATDISIVDYKLKGETDTQ